MTGMFRRSQTILKTPVRGIDVAELRQHSNAVSTILKVLPFAMTQDQEQALLFNCEGDSSFAN
jgi:hypothetical protein